MNGIFQMKFGNNFFLFMSQTMIFGAYYNHIFEAVLISTQSCKPCNHHVFMCKVGFSKMFSTWACEQDVSRGLRKNSFFFFKEDLDKSRKDTLKKISGSEHWLMNS